MIWKGAVLGLGNIAKRAHLPAYQSDATLQDKVQIVAGVDPVAAHRDEASRIVPGLRTYESHEQLFREESVDFVDICTPPDVHASLIRKAARKDLHILCEKPVARNLRDAKHIARTLQESPVVFVPCHQYRYAAVWRSLREILAQGRLGTFGFAQIDVFRQGPDPGALDWRPYWRVNPAISGGGILTDMGIHYIYLISSLLGTPERVWARTQSVTQKSVEDTALVVFQYPTGWAQFNLTWGAQRRETRFTFVGSRATAVYDGEKLSLVENGVTVTQVQELLSDKSSYMRWYVDLFRDFIARLEKSSPVPEYDGMLEATTTMQILAGIYRSAKLRREVRIEV